MADENHTQMLIQQQPPPPQQQNQMQQSQLQQQQMQPQQQMQQQPQQQAQAMSMGNTSDQQASHMNVTTSVPINVATINVSQAQQMQTMQQNVNTSSGTTVQMVPQLTAQAQTVQTGNMMSQSSGPHPTMIHPTMTMAQSPLQQVQVIQQPLSASYLQHLYPQQQMLFPGNLTLQHAGMTTPIQNLGATQGLSLQLQAKTTLDAKTSVGGQALQAVNTSNKGMAVNAGTMMTASGQVVGTTPKSNFPQQMMTTPGKSTIIHSQSGFAPANANQTVVIGQLGVLPNQQSIFNHKALADSQKGKTYTFHNQQAALQPKSLYSSSLPVHSTAQVFNGSHLKQITSQPQIITTQAGTMLGQAQFLGSLQALGSLPQGISWATPGCLQSSTLLTQNPIIIRSQQSDMFIQSPPQTAMHLPVAAATAPVPPTTCTPLAPQKPKQVRVRSGTQTVAVATQTVVSSAATVNSNATPIRTQIRPKSKLPTGSSPGASPSPLAPQMATTQTQTSQSHSQPQHQPTPQQKSDAANQTHSNQVKPVVPVASETKSTATQSKSIAIETKPLPPSLPVKSHAMVAPSTKIVQTTVSSTIGISTITSSSSTTPVSCAPVTTTATTANASTSVSAAVNTSPVLPYTPPASTNIAPEDVCPADDDTKPVSAPEESVEPVAQQTEPIELIESEPLKPQQPITKLPLGNVKEKLQKAIVKPQVLTHVIDGFVIQEGPEPFPVSRSSLFDSAEKLKKTEDSPIAASPEKKMKIHRPRGNVELAKCEFCGKMGPKSKFKRSKRFCSTSCAKRYNVCCSKRVGLLPSAVQENVAAGPGRKRKAGFKGRKGLRKQSQNENVEVSATQFEENTKSLKDESVLPVKIEDDNIEPAEGNPCPIVIQSEKEEEMEVVKSESEVIRKLPNKWSVQEVFQFICDLPGCSDYADEFRSQEIDGQALLLLKEDHLMNAMNMKLGPALKLISQINSIKEELSHS